MTRALRLLLNTQPEVDLLHPVSPVVQDFIDQYTMQMIEMKQNRVEVITFLCHWNEVSFVNHHDCSMTKCEANTERFSREQPMHTVDVPIASEL